MTESIAIPAKLEDLNSIWLSKILGDTIAENEIELEANIQKGSGFLSSMTRVRCKSGTKEYKLIVKLLPEDETMRFLVISEKFDNTEISFYQKVLPDLVKILPDLESYLCHFYYGQLQAEDSGEDYASVLVLEDLKSQGYYTINFVDEETPDQINEVIGFLAKFHFASMVLQEQKGNRLDKVYNFVQGADVKDDSMIYHMGNIGFTEVNRVLSENGGNADVCGAYQKLALHNDAIIKMALIASQKYPCLVHGDLWSNNLLFNDNSEFHTKVIDWQLLGYKDPNMDLAVTIISSLPMDKLTKENVDELLKLYYKLIVEQSTATGFPHLIKRDLENFSEFFYTWGMTFALLWCIMSSETFAINIPRSVRIYEFLISEMNVGKFIFSQLKL